MKPEPKKYDSYYLGMMISLKSWLQACPELGLIYTSPNDKLSPGFNISLEFDF